jgi:two-component system response regulator AtoC
MLIPEMGKTPKWEPYVGDSVYLSVNSFVMKPFRITIAEDDKWYGELLHYHLSLNPDYEVKLVESGAALIECLPDHPDVITLDYGLPDADGASLLQRIKSECPGTTVVIVSGQEDVNTAVELLREGAYDYIVKDDDAKNRLWKTIANIRENQALRQEVEHLREEVGKRYDFSNTILGSSAAIKKVFLRLEKAAQSSINVSITGETGTGKEVVAKAIHYNSDRKKQPFVAINVSAIPRELIESELFGHEKGSFTGASASRIGKFEEAKKGTLFLDEVGEMDMNMQVKLLRVLQEREIVRVGGLGTVKVECRIICATHRNLQEEVRNGAFREDLYYRLMGLPIELPPLRDRKEDIIVLAKHFMADFAKENKFPERHLGEDAIYKILRHAFPGNVRELKAVIDLAMVLCDDEAVRAEHIAFQNRDPSTDLNFSEMTLREYNYKILHHFLEKYDNNVTMVANTLDIGKSTIYRMLKETKDL